MARTSGQCPLISEINLCFTRLLPNSGLTGDLEYHVIEDPDQINAFVIPG